MMEEPKKCTEHSEYTKGCQVCHDSIFTGSKVDINKILRLGLTNKQNPVPVSDDDFYVDHREIVIEHGAGGIGDAALLATVVAALRDEQPNRKIVVRVGPFAFPFMKEFDFCDELKVSSRVHTDEPVHGALQANRGYHQEAKDKLQVSRWKRYAKNIGTTKCKIPKLKDERTIRNINRRYSGFVVLCPFSTDRSREWSLTHWRTLERLLNERGYECVILHSQEDLTHTFKSERAIGKPAPEVLSILYNAFCVIGSDSGLAHLAGLLNKPFVVLGGGTDVSKIFDPYASARFIQGGLECSNCCGDTAITTPRCQASCSNLQAITPERVAREIDTIWLKDHLTYEHSLIDVDRLSVLRREVLATNHLKGVCAELGVYKGGSAKLIAHYAKNTELHLFDTFAGMPENDQEPAGHHIKGEFPTTFEQVKAYLAEFKNIKFFVGNFPESLPCSAKYRFVHLDADIYQSMKAALDYFVPRMVKGGVIVADDYEWYACPGVAHALHERFTVQRVERGARYQAIVRF